MKKFKQRLLEFKKGLTSIDNREPLATLSLTVIIFLDLFVLSIIFSGLASHTSQLTAPNEYMPQIAKNIFIEKDWSSVDRIGQLQQLMLVDYNNYTFTANKVLDSQKIVKMHPKSKALFTAIKTAYDNEGLKNAFVTRQSLIRELHKYKDDFQRVKPLYDTHLAESNAGVPTAESSLETVAERAKDRSANYEKIHSQLNLLDQQINQHAQVQNLWKIIAPEDSTQREMLIKDLKRYELKYKFIELFWQLLFLLPIFIVIYLWHSKCVQKNKSIQTLIASHLLVVSAIPLIGKVVDVVVDLIPRYFFKKIFELLERLHIVAFWHYFVIILGVGVAIAAIYLIQKKLFKPEKLYRQRLERGQCYSCGLKLPNSHTKACPYCGKDQLCVCHTCKQETYFAGKYCIHCTASKEGL